MSQRNNLKNRILKLLFRISVASYRYVTLLIIGHFCSTKEKENSSSCDTNSRLNEKFVKAHIFRLLNPFIINDQVASNN